MLKNRSILEISGSDRKKFLQGLITNDVNKATEKNLIYAAMLNAQGRFLYDFFIFELAEKLIVDCDAARCDEILQKLNFYKLRSKVAIKKNDELAVFWSLENKNSQDLQFVDPRNPKMGFRIYQCFDKLMLRQAQHDTVEGSESYHFKRISLKIPEGENDLTYEKSFILEFGFDDLNAVDYQKGCYVGQEPTARIHHLGQIRKKIFHIEIACHAEALEALPKGSEITCEGKSIGLVLSSVFHQKKLHALALIKIPEDQDLIGWQEQLSLANNKIFILN